MHDHGVQAVKVYLDENRILHIEFGMSRRITLDMIVEAHRQHRAISTEKLPVIISADRLSRLDYDAQRMASSPEVAANTLATALMAHNFLHHHLIRIFTHYHRPPYPVRVFSDKQQALDWLQQLPRES